MRLLGPGSVRAAALAPAGAEWPGPARGSWQYVRPVHGTVSSCRQAAPERLIYQFYSISWCRRQAKRIQCWPQQALDGRDLLGARDSLWDLQSTCCQASAARMACSAVHMRRLGPGWPCAVGLASAGGLNHMRLCKLRLPLQAMDKPADCALSGSGEIQALRLACLHGRWTSQLHTAPKRVLQKSHHLLVPSNGVHLLACCQGLAGSVKLHLPDHVLHYGRHRVHGLFDPHLHASDTPL